MELKKINISSLLPSDLAGWFSQANQITPYFDNSNYTVSNIFTLNLIVFIYYKLLNRYIFLILFKKNIFYVN